MYLCIFLALLNYNCLILPSLIHNITTNKKMYNNYDIIVVSVLADIQNPDIGIGSELKIVDQCIPRFNENTSRFTWLSVTIKINHGLKKNSYTFLIWSLKLLQFSILLQFTLAWNTENCNKLQIHIHFEFSGRIKHHKVKSSVIIGYNFEKFRFYRLDQLSGKRLPFKSCRQTRGKVGYPIFRDGNFMLNLKMPVTKLVFAVWAVF